MRDRINLFFESIQQNPIELYSEFGLQHELAIFLRRNFADLNVKLEYPTTKIFNPTPDFIKKEIDLYITTENGLRYIIELKMPKADCGTPNEMYRVIQDVKFLEQLKQNNINECFSILFTQRQSFWLASRANAHIYRYFNGQSVNIESINNEQLPAFLQMKGEIELTNTYSANWCDYIDVNNSSWKYYVMEV